ncbi:hypothetical protein TBLA_0G03370 [Henningerozyma blattae CBS 6284]|uniref:GPI inositol-deacylase n=1 Tax=Henningerozyma blattae (strain ATCC 34711 / CBS 6284 / DSM 70876 / NBRC 10599 / NRRL Y-10934 / UCD 77-7) TaxID=1071380 RepID=I2H7C2_HENB6|nr:hypothetical protein TBLA_0G03370 [Tetrapisispora blattae CBS 6284]CCH62274.1 hypothetical protein TBLA_0G03370 [Tetrapisispora blattae CBS 6284]
MRLRKIVRNFDNKENTFLISQESDSPIAHRSKTMDLNVPPTKIPRSLFGYKNIKYFNYSAYIGIVTLLIFAFCNVLTHFNGADLPGCHQIYMYPSYARIDGFDERYTDLASKYHLYLYREQDKDKEPVNNDEIQLDGIPVLFIPGNAGSFKQVRSIAAASANLYFDYKEDITNEVAKNLDVFAADFNEDFTAFHGRTLLDQAIYLNDAVRYILELYEQSPSHKDTLPKSVIIVGHSMGGIVARVMPTLENYVDESITSIITLSTPHAAAPLTFDGDVLKLYEQTNDYWNKQFSNPNSYFSQHLSLISITGGISDMILPADYTAVNTIIPPANGFTTYSSNIPDVWTPIDHLAVVWCDQLRQVIAQLLLESVDSTSPSKVKSLAERIAIAKHLLLSGFEEESYQMETITNEENQYTALDQDKLLEAYNLKTGDILTIRLADVTELPSYIKVIIPKDTASTYQFSMLSSLHNIKIRFCTNKKKALPDNDDNSVYFNCVSEDDLFATIPNPSEGVFLASDSSMDSDHEPYKMLVFTEKELSKFDFIIIETPPIVEMKASDYSVIAMETDYYLETTKYSPFYTTFFGFTELVPETAFVRTFKHPKIWNSLFSYRVTSFLYSVKVDNFLFRPFVRQWVKSPLESKWHMDVLSHSFDVNMHNKAPFVPYEPQDTNCTDCGLNMVVIVPPRMDLQLEWSVNWPLTIKMLFIRYRLAIASFPTFFISGIIAIQFYYYNKTEIYPAFEDVTNMLIKRYSIPIVISFFLLSPVTSTRFVQRILYWIDPLKVSRPLLFENEGIYSDIYYLGISDIFPSLLGPVFGYIAIGIVYTFCMILKVCENLIKKITRSRIFKGKLYVELPPNMKNQGKILGKTRLAAAFLLVLMVIFYIPYQLAFLLVVIVQIGTCGRIASISGIERTKDYSNLRNYNFSILLLSLFVAAINFPVIIVFLHNVAIRWETSFRSHHNFLAIAPVILLFASNSNFRVPRFQSNGITDGGLAIILFGYLSCFSLVYGIRNTYWIHYIFNVICIWLLYNVTICTTDKRQA